MSDRSEALPGMKPSEWYVTESKALADEARSTGNRVLFAEAARAVLKSMHEELAEDWGKLYPGYTVPPMEPGERHIDYISRTRNLISLMEEE